MTTTPIGLSMRGRLGFLLKDSALYGGAAAISKAFALITFPILARHFTVTEYGVLDYYLVLASLLSTFFVFGQDSAVARYFYEYEGTEDRRQLISQSLLFQIVGLVLLIPFLWVGAEWLVNLIVDANHGVLFLRIILLQLPFLLLINFSKNLLKWTFRRTHFLLISLGYTVVQVCLLVVAVYVFDVGIAGVLFVILVTSVIFGLLGLYFIREWLARPCNLNRLIEMFPYAIPIGVICVASAYLPAMERTLTHLLLGPTNLGYYAAATKIAMLVSLLVGAFQTAWGPFSMSLYKQENAAHTFNLVFKLFALGVCLGTLFITLLSQTLINFLATTRYSDSIIVVFPLVMGLSIQAISWITEVGIGISKRSYLNLYSYSISILSTLLSIWLLAPIFGLIGVGIGALVGQIVKAIVASWLSQQAYRLPWQYGQVIIVIGLTMLIGLVSIWVGIELGNLVKNIVLVLGLIIVSLVGWHILLSQEERNEIKFAIW
jgi:O-antigen/teichoic acid export membrane protein